MLTRWATFLAVFYSLAFLPVYSQEDASRIQDDESVEFEDQLKNGLVRFYFASDENDKEARKFCAYKVAATFFELDLSEDRVIVKKLLLVLKKSLQARRTEGKLSEGELEDLLEAFQVTREEVKTRELTKDRKWTQERDALLAGLIVVTLGQGLYSGAKFLGLWGKKAVTWVYMKWVKKRSTADATKAAGKAGEGEKEKTKDEVWAEQIEKRSACGRALVWIAKRAAATAIFGAIFYVVDLEDYDPWESSTELVDDEVIPEFDRLMKDIENKIFAARGN